MSPQCLHPRHIKLQDIYKHTFYLLKTLKIKRKCCDDGILVNFISYLFIVELLTDAVLTVHVT
jgi:hypothetical protein